MAVIHIVLFKFQPTVPQSHKSTFIHELETLKNLPSVLNKQLFVGGPSITDPIERSKGYEFALVSFHRDREALREYQASAEHHRVTSEYFWPYKEDVTRFDFEVGEAGREMGDLLVKGLLGGGERGE
ncbi:stress responsive A/B barrel domain-containing protein [Periconia macrospinosa]|uniref:Stress responsive A/B barrel domain-containing protein n=1 Tax=Periconia macrospinosa TaxID=97972 RepID=A0A2V1DCM4_9PLEO|nr:stress responsive A/B barrel domain-containing protein [Periconia macrospinosa]